ncbi:hypothetical protein NOCARDAX2BIS_200048 [Nocardioides sp. AX2bis]|nr:hypothetical protein NOCARDAX2BIS_200048 [Nocardioides sp. AX2bis]
MAAVLGHPPPPPRLPLLRRRGRGRGACGGAVDPDHRRGARLRRGQPYAGDLRVLPRLHLRVRRRLLTRTGTRAGPEVPVDTGSVRRHVVAAGRGHGCLGDREVHRGSPPGRRARLDLRRGRRPPPPQQRREDGVR